MPDGLEVELKLEIAPRDVETLTKSGPLSKVTVLTQALDSVYFDTPAGDVRRAGFSLRVRHVGNRRIQTIKAESAVAAGLFVRPEWEREIDGDAPVLDFAGAPLGQMIGPDALPRLAPVFRTVVTREIRNLPVGRGAAEVVLDRGEIIAGDRRLAICEIELEMRGGSWTALFALARELDELAPLRLGVLSKSERGYRLIDERSAQADKAEPIFLSPEMTAGAAFQTIARACVRQFRLSETVLANGDDADALHEARVGLRRLRSAISLFRAMFAGDGEAERLCGELRWLAGAFGDARDIDVLIRRVTDGKVREPLFQSRRDAYASVEATSASTRARRLMLDLAAWLSFGSWLTKGTDPERPDQPILPLASAILERHRRRLKRRGKRLARVDDHHRHEARIEAKKLRYAAEFFTSLYPHKKARRRRKAFLEALEALQSHLGDLNDQVTGPMMVARLGLGGAVAADLATTTKRDRPHLLDEAEDAQARLMDTKRFWR